MEIIKTNKYGQIKFGIQNFTNFYWFELLNDELNKKITHNFCTNNSIDRPKLNFALNFIDKKEFLQEIFHVVIIGRNNNYNYFSKFQKDNCAVLNDPVESVLRVSQRFKAIESSFWSIAETNIILCDKNFEPIFNDKNEPLIFSIKLNYYGHYEKIFSAIKGDLNLFSYNISSYFNSWTQIWDLNKNEKKFPSAFQLFIRISKIVDEFIYLTNLLTSDPNSCFELSYENISTESLLEMNNFDIEISSLNMPLNFAANSSLTILKYNVEFNTIENNFIKKSLEKVISLILTIQRTIENEINLEKENLKFITKNGNTRFIIEKEERLTRFSFELNRLNNYLTKLINLNRNFLPNYNLQNYNAYNLVFSERFNSDYRFYRYNYLLNFMEGLTSFFDTSDDGVPFEIASFNKLYEIWCFIKVIEAFEKLNFVCNNKSQRNYFHNTFLENHPYTFRNSDYPNITIKLYYSKHYPKEDKLNNEFQYGLPCEQNAKSYYDEIRLKNSYHNHKKFYTKSSPDIAIEIFNSKKSCDCPEIITLDCTLSNNQNIIEDKCSYLNAIRCSKELDEFSEYKCIVVASWVFNVGNEEEFNNDQYIKPLQQHNRFMNEVEKYRQGKFVLNYKEQSINNLPAFLSILLNYYSSFNIVYT